ncbi:MAG: dephospho-CoA kinase [Holophagales bacterium]|nr:dephospho-CoA kinase [Holophagales bacterium]
MAEEGFHVIDADRIVAELYAPGGEGSRALRQLIGAEALTATGAVDKPELARRIFTNPELRSQVEAAIHPLVHEHFVGWAAERRGVVVYEATLLVESGHAGRFHEVITIEAPREQRLEWAVARGMERAQAEARLEAQGDGAERRRAATRIVRNEGSLDDLRSEIEALARELRAKASA